MTRVQLTYQGYDAHHLPEMTDLWVASWQKSYPDIDFEQRRAWAVERFVALNAQGVAFLLAFDKACGDMAGFLSLDFRSGHIDQVVVAIPYWGRGVADQLLTEAQRQRPQGLKLEVNTENTPAIELYVRHGFRKVGEGVNANSGRTFVYMERPGEPN